MLRINVRKVLLAGLTGVLLVASALSASADGLTVGLLLNAAGSFDGYTLFTPIAEGNAYLVDNAGKAVHAWHEELGGSLATPPILCDGVSISPKAAAS